MADIRTSLFQSHSFQLGDSNQIHMRDLYCHTVTRSRICVVSLLPCALPLRLSVRSLFTCCLLRRVNSRCNQNARLFNPICGGVCVCVCVCVCVSVYLESVAFLISVLLLDRVVRVCITSLHFHS